MRELLPLLGDHDLVELARALRSGRLAAPYSVLALQRYLRSDQAAVATRVFASFFSGGLGAADLAVILEAIAADRVRYGSLHGAVDIVSTGPEAAGVANRDTAAVIRELFTQAEADVLAVGYAVYGGRTVFKALADRMAALPGLRARLLLDVRREGPDTSADSEIVVRFAHGFQTREWPGSRLPEVYYDPRALDTDRSRRASLHAKCVVVDRKRVLVSSANFTEAAHVRNIELGLLVNDAALAERVAQHFDRLIESGVLQALA